MTYKKLGDMVPVLIPKLAFFFGTGNRSQALGLARQALSLPLS